MAFIDVRMPERICYAFSGGPSFNTTMGEATGGYTQAQINRDDAYWKYRSSAILKDDALRLELIGFHLVLRGRGHTFRFRDRLHYWHGMQWQGTSLVFLAPANIPSFATGNGVTTVFQLYVPYPIAGGAYVYNRKITKPAKPETGYAGPKIWFGTTEQVSGWSINYSTGLITFNVAPPNGTIIRFAGLFDVHVRFASDDMELTLDDSPEASDLQVELMEELDA